MEKKAWQYARDIMIQAIPKLLSEEEQTWEASITLGEGEDMLLKLLWNSNVPGSNAPESIMLATIQATENLGYVVEGGTELWLEGQKALDADDMPLLNAISAELWNKVHQAKIDPEHPSHSFKKYKEWEEYEADVKFSEAKEVDRNTLEEKTYAGWLGQIAGGALGTMIEGYTTDRIREAFGEVREYLRKPSTYNDDITYELAFLLAFEEHGAALTSADIAKAWIAYVPSGWSAEQMALRNIRWGIMPPESGTLGNPFGEWIGAQMRGAICGMVAPGNPKEAARLAWLDGQVSHFNNGIIGEIFNAMLVSLAYVETDIRKLLESCIDMIPKRSEYYSVVKFALDKAKQEGDWEKAWRLCEKQFEKYNWIHAYPNAAAEVIALWFGEGSFDETAYIISMAGQDVDCNAAQILTAIGIMDPQGIRSEWTDPIGDELKTYLRRYRSISIKDLAKRTADVAI